MKVALISGLFPDSQENGLLSLALKIQTFGYITSIHHWNDASIDAADIYIGHSFGGCRVFKECSGKIIQYLALIDPVAYGWDWFLPSKNFTIPLNVLKADGFRRIRPWFPAPSSLILNRNTHYCSWDEIQENHKDMPRNDFVVNIILSSLRALNAQ